MSQCTRSVRFCRTTPPSVRRALGERAAALRVPCLLDSSASQVAWLRKRCNRVLFRLSMLTRTAVVSACKALPPVPSTFSHVALCHVTPGAPCVKLSTHACVRRGPRGGGAAAPSTLLPMTVHSLLPHPVLCVNPQLCDEGPLDDDEGEEGLPSYRELLLPATELAGQWEVG